MSQFSSTSPVSSQYKFNEVYKVLDGRALYWVIEDPDTTKNRIFMNGYAHDISTLKPIAGEYFIGQTTAERVTSNSAGTAYPQTANMGYQRLWLSGLLRWNASGYVLAEGFWLHGNQDPYISTLDPWNFLPKFSIKLRSGLIYISDLTGFDAGTPYAGTAYKWFYYDLTGAAAANMNNSATSPGSYNGAFHLYYEDPQVDNVVFASRLFGRKRTFGKLQIGVGVGDNASYTELLDPGEGYGITLGRTGDGGVIWTHLDPQRNRLTFYEFFEGSNTTYRTVYSHITDNNYVGQFIQWPSNFLHVSDTKKQFWQAAFESHTGHGNDATYPRNIAANKRLYFYRFTYDPINVTIVRDRIYPEFPGDSTDFIRLMDFNASTTAQWNTAEPTRGTTRQHLYRPHVFNVSQRNFITLTFQGVDLFNRNNDFIFRNMYQSAGLHYHGPWQNVWITFELIGDRMVFHSTYFWGEWSQLPESWMPLSPNGNQIFVALAEGAQQTMSFNVVTGWVAHDRINQYTQTYGLDSTGRLWTVGYNAALSGSHRLVLNDAGMQRYASFLRGWGQYHIYKWTNPIQIKISAAQTALIYTGTISTSTLYLDVYDYTGERLSKNVRISISGSGLTFPDGTTSQVVVSNTASTTATNITLTGAGRPTVTANLA